MSITSLVSLQALSSNKVPATTSLKIAEFTGKEHFIVLRDVENLISEGHISESNFVFSTYQGVRRKEKMCVLDEDATTLLLMGYTGKEAMTWKKAYIAEFKRMREELSTKKNVVQRIRHDDYSSLYRVQQTVADHVRKTVEGKEGHVGYYVNLNKETDIAAFGYYEKGMRQSMTKEQADSLRKTLETSVSIMLNKGITNPKKLGKELSKSLVMTSAK
jgi:Rha family phage regulatory protein